MAGIKTTYGKRSKKTTAFCSMTDLFTSPTEQPTELKPAKTAEGIPERRASKTNELRDDRIKDGTKVEREKRALQPVDTNVVCSPSRRPKAKLSRSTTRIECEARGASSPPGALDLGACMSTIMCPEKLPSTATVTSELKSAKSGRKKSSHVSIPEHRRLNPVFFHVRNLLRLCSDPTQRKFAPKRFSTWAASLEPRFRVIKIAEASYGEVYRLALNEDFYGFTKSDESVLKMIALKPPPTVDRPRGKRRTEEEKELDERIENMSSVESVVGEVKLLKRMSEVPGFTNFRAVEVLRGAPSEPFIKAWRDWNDARPEGNKSVFADPGVEGSYDASQLWAVIEMQDAGSDLEERDLEAVGGVFGVWDIFWGVVLALGKGEEEAHFEHRDLHMGNICIRPINSNKPIAAPSSADQLARKLNFTGLETTLIDYTLSRAQMTSPSRSPEPKLIDIAYEDLELQDYLFEADASENYQYEIYRYMRGAMFLDDPLADVDARKDEAKAKGRTWAGFHPQTNLMWLHFVLHEMMYQITPTKKNKKGRSNGRRSRKKEASKVEKSFEELLVEKKLELEKILEKLEDLLDPDYVASSGVWSARDLIVLAMKEGWLDEQDVIAGDDDDAGKSFIEGFENPDAKRTRAASPMTQIEDLLEKYRL